jgi:hypothetical protein
MPFALKQNSIRHEPVDSQNAEPVYSAVPASTRDNDLLETDLAQYPLT